MEEWKFNDEVEITYKDYEDLIRLEAHEVQAKILDALDSGDSASVDSLSHRVKELAHYLLLATEEHNKELDDTR